MHPLQLLPALMALMSAYPVLTAPTSKNDPFRAIVLRIPKPDLPVCCLRPLPTVGPVEDDVLLSFEEWKVKQSAVKDQAKTKEQDAFNRSAEASLSEVAGNGGNGSEVASAVVSESAAPGSPLDVGDTIELSSVAVSPHFRVPITDRFNYANLDCSARVHLAHRSAKSSSSILSSKRDRYMLSPCNPPKKEQQFVVVELCEDIRIDTVQLANFEFFSGVFKDFRVSVAKTYTTEAEGWTTAGTYRARNIRGVQSFHTPKSLRDFYRYIRIDFLSHYGNEFYCPVSLLRVYGLTHLEEWKWETWEAESKARLDGSAKVDLATPASVTVADYAPPSEVESEGKVISTISPNETTALSDSIPTTSTIASSSTSESLPVEASAASCTTDFVGKFSAVSIVGAMEGQASTSEIAMLRDNPDLPTVTSEPSVTPSVSAISLTVTDKPSVSSSSDIAQVSASSSSDAAGDTPSVSRTSSYSTTSHTASTVSNSGSTASTATVSTAASASVSMPVVPPPVAVTTGGESIYRTIMNRLTALEANHTLYARYVEQQTGAVREMLRRLGEDVGRLEGIGRAQAQMYQRTVHDWEKRQHRLQVEHGELVSRVQYLSDEIVLEKRLGIAQLCLLLAVLVFVGLTRGSRGESFMEHAPGQFNRSMREWSKRHLSFSGDWTNRFKSKSRSRSVTRSPAKQRRQPLTPLQITLDADSSNKEKDLSSKDTSKRGLTRPNHINTSLTDSFRHRQLDMPSHTPTQRTAGGRHHQHNTRPVIPVAAFRSHPGIQRSSSQGGTHYPYGPSTPAHVPAPRSVRRWARTAHLHEVKQDSQGRSPRTRSRESTPVRENGVVDVFSAPATVPRAPVGHWKRDLPSMAGDWKGKSVLPSDSTPGSTPSKNKEGEGDPWEDTDLDVGELEEVVEWGLKVDTVRAGLVSGKEH